MKSIVLAGLLVGVGMFGLTNPVSALSKLDARVCNATEQATLTIGSPQTDSVTNESAVTVSGTVKQSNQLEVYVDGAFNGVEPIPYDATTYITSISLSPGTHTIQIIAIDACQVGNASAEVVLTYEPVPVPSTGAQVPTTVDGTTINNQPLQSQAPMLEQFFIKPLVSLGRALDLLPADTVNTMNDRSNLPRFIVISLGILLIAFSNYLTKILTRVAAKINLGAAIIVGINRRGRKFLIAVGVALIVIVFLI